LLFRRESQGKGGETDTFIPKQRTRNREEKQQKGRVMGGEKGIAKAVTGQM